MVGGMMRYELRKVSAFYIPALTVLIGYVLLRGRPLTGDDPMVIAIAIGHGWLLAWRIFSDPGNTRPFIFSRPLSRRRLFLIRWISGIILQALSLCAVFALIALGLRSWLQIELGSLYHPMVRWFELEVLPSIGLFSLLAYEIGMFLKLRSEVSPDRPKSRSQGFAIGLTVLFLLLLFMNFALQPSRGPILPARNVFILSYIAVVSVLATAASARCYNCMEVKA
jgi:hypothetical protein